MQSTRRKQFPRPWSVYAKYSTETISSSMVRQCTRRKQFPRPWSINTKYSRETISSSVVRQCKVPVGNTFLVHGPSMQSTRRKQFPRPWSVNAKYSTVTISSSMVHQCKVLNGNNFLFVDTEKDPAYSKATNFQSLETSLVLPNTFNNLFPVAAQRIWNYIGRDGSRIYIYVPTPKSTRFE